VRLDIYAVCTRCGSRTRVTRVTEKAASFCCVAPVTWTLEPGPALSTAAPNARTRHTR